MMDLHISKVFCGQYILKSVGKWPEINYPGSGNESASISKFYGKSQKYYIK